MRVCHVVECGGGVGNVIVDLVREGRKAGDEITVIYGTTRLWPSFVEQLKSIGNVTMATSTMRRPVGLHDFADAVDLYGLLRRYGPFDIINAHSSKAGALVRLMRPLFPRTKIIYTPHAFMTMAPEASKVYGWIERILSSLCNAIVCVSEQERQHATQKLHISPSLLTVIPNGIDIHVPSDRAAARQKFGVNNEAFIVGFVGRLESQKNPLNAVEAFASAAEKHSNLGRVMIGYGSLQPDIERVVAAKGLSNLVLIMQDLNARSLFAGFDCLICSSEYESFGLVILEALASGVPVVTTPVGIAENAIINGENGVITADFKATALADGLDRIASATETERLKISVSAKSQAAKFSVETMGAATRSLYKKLLGQ
jgi:glycosyltransferase involved in cell wall biosynthesis